MLARAQPRRPIIVPYGGIDAHRSYLTIAIVDKQGTLLAEEGRVPVGDGEPLLAALEEYRPLEVVVETCSFWPWIADTLEPTEVGFQLAHAKRLEAIADAKTKSDSVDARLLARMLATDLIPAVYPKPPSQREICRLIRHRDALVEQRTTLCNRIHGHLQQQGLRLGPGKLLTSEGRQWLREEAWSWLEDEQKALVESHLELIDTLIPKIGELDGRIEATADEHPAATLLQSIPGIGPYRSLKLAGEITPIERFPSADHLVCYGGLAPITRQSGAGDPWHGGMPNDANRAVRDVFHSAVGDHIRAAPESSVTAFYPGSCTAGRLTTMTALSPTMGSP